MGQRDRLEALDGVERQLLEQAVINEVGAKKSVQAILDNQPDAPGYPQKDTLFPYGFGLTC